MQLPEGYERRGIPEQLRRFFDDNIERCLALSWNKDTRKLDRAEATYRLHSLMRSSALAWLTGTDHEAARFVLSTIWVDPAMRYLCAVMVDREIQRRHKEWSKRAESGEKLTDLNQLKPQKRAVVSYRGSDPENPWPTMFAEHATREEVELMLTEQRKIATKADKHGDFLQEILDLWPEDADTLGEAIDNG